MSSCSCSHWWHAPIYLTLSIFLAIVSITSFKPPPSSTTTTTAETTFPSQQSFPTTLTTTLQNNNFTIMSTLLQFSPQLFLPSSSSSCTVFTIHDTAFSTISTSPSTMQLLLQYHTLPLKLTSQELITKPNFSCLNTLIPSKNLSLTKIHDDNRNNSVILINNVTISHPDLFTDESISIHGVLATFTSLQNQTSFPNCNENRVIENYELEWSKMIRTLSATGFISFAIGLNSILDQILQENRNLTSATILAPLEFGFVGSSDWLLDKTVRYHVLNQRYSYAELSALPDKTLLTTLLPGSVVEVTVNGNVDVLRGLAVNGVDVVAAGEAEAVYSSRMFVVLGISRVLDFLDRPSN